jgi:hypothetical protein
VLTIIQPQSDVANGQRTYMLCRVMVVGSQLETSSHHNNLYGPTRVTRGSIDHLLVVSSECKVPASLIIQQLLFSNTRTNNYHPRFKHYHHAKHDPSVTIENVLHKLGGALLFYRSVCVFQSLSPSEIKCLGYGRSFPFIVCLS